MREKERGVVVPEKISIRQRSGGDPSPAG